MKDLDSDCLLRHARWIQRSGVLLFLLGLFNGFFVHTQAVPDVVLAAHLVAIMGGTFLIAIGLLWSGLRLSRRASGAGCWLAVYGFFSGWLPYLLAGVAGIGGMFPLAAGPAQGTAAQEEFMGIACATAAMAVIGLCALILWGLRGSRRQDAAP